MLNLGLRIEDLDGDGVSLALRYRQADRSLSLPDSFALALAQRNSWTLLSGDGGLRELARSEGVACHGVLWLTDRIFEHGTIPGSDLRASLRRIASHPIHALDFLLAKSENVCGTILRYEHHRSSPGEIEP